MVLEEPTGMDWGYTCPSKAGAGCVLLQVEGKDTVFYLLDLVHGKGERLGAVERSRGYFLSFDGSRMVVVGAKGHEGQMPDSFSLLYVTLAGKVRPLFRNSVLGSMRNPIPSPDGKYLAYAGWTADSNVWILENL